MLNKDISIWNSYTLLIQLVPFFGMRFHLRFTLQFFLAAPPPPLFSNLVPLAGASVVHPTMGALEMSRYNTWMCLKPTYSNVETFTAVPLHCYTPKPIKHHITTSWGYTELYQNWHCNDVDDKDVSSVKNHK